MISDVCLRGYMLVSIPMSLVIDNNVDLRVCLDGCVERAIEIKCNLSWFAYDRLFVSYFLS